MAYESWLDTTGSYLLDTIRWGDKTESPFMEVHQRLLRLAEAYKYRPVALADEDEYFAEPLVRWGLTRIGLDSTGGEADSWVSQEFNMRENFPRSTMCEYCQRAMAAVVTMAREKAIYYTDEDPWQEELTIARNEDWTEYTGAGSWDSTGYDYTFEIDAYSDVGEDGPYDWSISDRPSTMTECLEWLEKIRDVLDELRYFCIPYDEVRLIESDPVIEIGLNDSTSEEINFNIPYVLNGITTSSTRARREHTDTLQTVQTPDDDGWDGWSPEHTGKGTSHLLSELDFDFTDDLPAGVDSTSIANEWNLVSAGTEQEFDYITLPVDSTSKMIVDVYYVPEDSTSGAMIPSWDGHKWYHYSDATSILVSAGSNSYNRLVTDSYYGRVVLASELGSTPYVDSFVEESKEGYAWTKSCVDGAYSYAFGESFTSWWSNHWFFLPVPLDEMSWTWTYDTSDVVHYTYYDWTTSSVESAYLYKRYLQIDFSDHWEAITGSAYPTLQTRYTQKGWATTPLSSGGTVHWDDWSNVPGQWYAGSEWLETHIPFNYAPFSSTDFNTDSPKIFKDKRAESSELVPVTTDVQPPNINAWQYGGVQLQDGVRLARVLKCHVPTFLSVEKAEIIGAGNLEMLRHQKVADLYVENHTLTETEKNTILEKDPGKIGVGFVLTPTTMLYTYMYLPVLYEAGYEWAVDSGIKLDEKQVSALPQFSKQDWDMTREYNDITANFGYGSNSTFALFSEVLEEYTPNYHYQEFPQTFNFTDNLYDFFNPENNQPWRYSVLPSLAYRPDQTDTKPLYAVYAYITFDQDV